MSRDPHGSGSGSKGSGSRRSGVPQMGRTYQAALEAVMAVAVAGVAGAFADTWLDTGPLFLVVGVLVGFGAFVLRMVRLLDELAARSRERSGTDDDGTDSSGGGSGDTGR